MQALTWYSHSARTTTGRRAEAGPNPLLFSLFIIFSTPQMISLSVIAIIRSKQQTKQQKLKELWQGLIIIKTMNPKTKFIQMILGFLSFITLWNNSVFKSFQRLKLWWPTWSLPEDYSIAQILYWKAAHMSLCIIWKWRIPVSLIKMIW